MVFVVRTRRNNAEINEQIILKTIVTTLRMILVIVIMITVITMIILLIMMVYNKGT